MSNELKITKPNQPAQVRESILDELEVLVDEGFLDKEILDHFRTQLTYSGELHLHMEALIEKTKQNNEALKRTKEYEKKMKLKGFTKYKKSEIEQTNHEVKGALDIIKKQLIANGLPENRAKALKM